jgi:hypothetical protein
MLTPIELIDIESLLDRKPSLDLMSTWVLTQGDGTRFEGVQALWVSRRT